MKELHKMSEVNARTLETYSAGVDAYLEGTNRSTSGEQKEWLDQVVTDVDINCAILEIGSAFGRDASYLQSLGYKVDCTDGSTGFVDYLNEHGFDAKVLNIIEQTPANKYDLVLACAVFLHFSIDDFRRALANVRVGLNEDGRFAFSVKHGDGEEWSEAKMDAPRYFKYWRENALRGELARAGFRVTDVQHLEQDKWLHVLSEVAES